MWNFHYRGKSNGHTCMQRHPHDKDEWGRYGQLRLGKVSAAPGPPAFHRHPHALMFTQILAVKRNCKYFPQESAEGIEVAFTAGYVRKSKVASSLTLLPRYGTSADTDSKSMHTNTQTMLTHQWIQIGLNSPPAPPPMQSGAPQIPCNPSNCTF